MTEKFNIFNHKPVDGEAIYLPCFTTAGGYIRTKWNHNCKDYCNSETVLFKDWQSAQAATKFLLDYIKNTPNRFSCLKTDHIGPIYILKMGHLNGSFHQQSFRDYSDIEYLMESGLVYVTEKDVLKAKEELDQALHSKVMVSNRSIPIDIDKLFNYRHPLEDKLFYVPDSYSGTVISIRFKSDNPDHNRLLDQNLLFTCRDDAIEVLQTWLDLPIINNNSRLKED